MEFLHCTSTHALQILKRLLAADCICKIDSQKYYFPTCIKISDRSFKSDCERGAE